MQTAPTMQGDARFMLRVSPLIQLSDEQFYSFCIMNRQYQFEKTGEGDVIVMAPTSGDTGWRNSKLIARLVVWAEQNGSGISFDSSTGFILPNGAIRSPDGAWVKRSRLSQLSERQKQQFLPICPDFVIELRSPSDLIKDLQDKLKEYIENGTQLGWLIDPQNRRVYVYRPNLPVECVNNPTTISGDPVLPGFVMNISEIWTPDF